MPQPIRKRLRRFRNLPDAIRNIFHPAKIVRTTLYHSGLYRISKTKFRGLHIGSGGHRIDGFLNFDADPFVDCDVVADATKVKLGSNMVSTIYASHLVEHIPRAKVAQVVTEWLRVLEPGGKLYLSIPNLETLTRVYLDSIGDYETEDGRDDAEVARNIIYGGQSDKFDFHYSGYSFVTIKALLLSFGFSSVDTFTDSDIDFAAFHEGHSARLRGLSISLNVVAVK